MKEKRRNRSFGKRSPLDRLAKPISSALVKRAGRPGVTLANLRAWLKRTHGVTASLNALCQWRIRREEMNASRTISSRFEIEVIAPGARSVRVAIRPLSTPQGKGANS